MRTVVVVLVLSIAAFVAGRYVPRSRDSVAAPSAVSPAQKRVADVAPPPASASDPPPPPSAAAASAAAPAVPPEWLELVRADPELARSLRTRVIDAVQPRGASDELATCLAREPVTPSLEVRFAVDVEVLDEDLRIGNAHFVEVVEGPVISDAATQCLERALAGEDVIDGTGSAAFAGRVDYRLTIRRSR
jgi:hypothetical protein